MAVAPRTYELRPVAAGDLAMLEGWLRQRHVAKWWRDADAQLAEIRTAIESPDTEPLLVSVCGTPFGYLQVYDAAASFDPVLRRQPAGTRGIDFMIGDPAYLRQGHGHAIVRQIADRELADRAPRIVADPDPRNVDAIGCLGRAGFAPAGIHVGPWGRVLVMQRNRAATGNAGAAPGG